MNYAIVGNGRAYFEMLMKEHGERYNQFCASEVRRNAGKDATPKPAAQ